MITRWIPAAMIALTAGCTPARIVVPNDIATESDVTPVNGRAEARGEKYTVEAISTLEGGASLADPMGFQMRASGADAELTRCASCPHRMQSASGRLRVSA